MEAITKVLFASSFFFVVYFQKKVPLVLFKVAHTLTVAYLRLTRQKSDQLEEIKTNAELLKSNRQNSSMFRVPSVQHMAYRKLLLSMKFEDLPLSGWRMIADYAPFFNSVFTENSTAEHHAENNLEAEMCGLSTGNGLNLESKYKVKILQLTAHGVKVGATMEERKEQKVLVFFHGGGYVSCTPDSYIGVMSALSKRCQMPVFCPDYRRCPEASMKSQLSDCVTGYLYVITKLGFSAENVVVAGDSAGGGLTLGTLQYLLKRFPKSHVPSAGVLISPFSDMASAGESYSRNRNSCASIPSKLAQCLGTACCPPGTDPTDGSVSYMNGEYEGLPPLYITASETELLYSDAVCIYKNAKKAGVKVYFESAPYGVHDYPLLADYAPEYADSLARLCAFIKIKTGKQSELA